MIGLYFVVLVLELHFMKALKIYKELRLDEENIRDPCKFAILSWLYVDTCLDLCLHFLSAVLTSF